MNHAEKLAKRTVNATFFSWHHTWPLKTAFCTTSNQTLPKVVLNFSRNQQFNKTKFNQVFAGTLQLYFGKALGLILRIQGSAKINVSKTPMNFNAMTIVQTRRDASFSVPVRGISRRILNRFSFTIALKVSCCLIIKHWEWMSGKILLKNHTFIPKMIQISCGLIVPKLLMKIMMKLCNWSEKGFVKIIHSLEMFPKGNAMIFVLTTIIAT